MKQTTVLTHASPVSVGSATAVVLVAVLLGFTVSGSTLAADSNGVGDSPREAAGQAQTNGDAVVRDRDATATDSLEHVALDELSPEERGWVIAARSDRSDRGFADSVVEFQMILRNAAGKEATRTLSLRTLEMPDEGVGDKSLIVFFSPADIDGTALLSHAKILEPDDQWLYLPALKRVKRISSVNKSGPFVGSEFAFEDFTALELEKYDYRYLRSEACGDLVCDVIERIPRYEHSGYTKQIAWVDQEIFQVRQVEFYDRRGDLLKTLTLEDYRPYASTYWRSHQFSMVNHQTGKETDLVYADYRFGIGVKESDFVRGALQRIR